jgi:S-DNA-T family DNA segregation ATPase FtsK/SpoIIIE
VSVLRRELRPDSRPPSLRFRSPNVHVPLWLLALGWLLVLTWRGLRWLCRHPRATVVLAVTGALVWTDTVMPAGVVLALGLCVLTGWWAVDPGTFRAVVLERVQLRLREWFTYRRDWQPAVLTAGLTLRDSWGGDLPTLRSVRADAGSDVLRVRMLPGQTLEDWRTATAALAQTFGVRQCRVRKVPNRLQEVELIMARRRPLRHVTKSPVEQEPQQAPAVRGAFPRQPRGAA